MNPTERLPISNNSIHTRLTKTIRNGSEFSPRNVCLISLPSNKVQFLCIHSYNVLKKIPFSNSQTVLPFLQVWLNFSYGGSYQFYVASAKLLIRSLTPQWEHTRKFNNVCREAAEKSLLYISPKLEFHLRCVYQLRLLIKTYQKRFQNHHEFSYE